MVAIFAILFALLLAAAAAVIAPYKKRESKQRPELFLIDNLKVLETKQDTVKSWPIVKNPYLFNLFSH